MTDYLIDLPIDRHTLETIANPTRVHGLATSYLPQLRGRSHSIRADTATQFRIDLPHDPLGRPGIITLRMRTGVLPKGVGIPIGVPGLHEGTQLSVVLAAEKRNTGPDGKKVTRAVTDEEAHTWATELLSRHGMTPTALAVGPMRPFGPPPIPTRARFHIRDVLATITITDPALARTAMTRGVGRGRSYGLGMLIPTSKETHR